MDPRGNYNPDIAPEIWEGYYGEDYPVNQHELDQYYPSRPSPPEQVMLYMKAAEDLLSELKDFITSAEPKTRHFHRHKQDIEFYLSPYGKPREVPSVVRSYMAHGSDWVIENIYGSMSVNDFLCNIPEGDYETEWVNDRLVVYFRDIPSLPHIDRSIAVKDFPLDALYKESEFLTLTNWEAIPGSSLYELANRLGYNLGGGYFGEYQGHTQISEYERAVEYFEPEEPFYPELRAGEPESWPYGVGSGYQEDDSEGYYVSRAMLIGPEHEKEQALPISYGLPMKWLRKELAGIKKIDEFYIKPYRSARALDREYYPELVSEVGKIIDQVQRTSFFTFEEPELATAHWFASHGKSYLALNVKVTDLEGKRATHQIPAGYIPMLYYVRGDELTEAVDELIEVTGKKGIFKIGGVVLKGFAKKALPILELLMDPLEAFTEQRAGIGRLIKRYEAGGQEEAARVLRGWSMDPRTWSEAIWSWGIRKPPGYDSSEEQSNLMEPVNHVLPGVLEGKEQALSVPMNLPDVSIPEDINVAQAKRNMSAEMGFSHEEFAQLGSRADDELSNVDYILSYLRNPTEDDESSPVRLLGERVGMQMRGASESMQEKYSRISGFAPPAATSVYIPSLGRTASEEGIFEVEPRVYVHPQILEMVEDVMSERECEESFLRYMEQFSNEEIKE